MRVTVWAGGGQQRADTRVASGQPGLSTDRAVAIMVCEIQCNNCDAVTTYQHVCLSSG